MRALFIVYFGCEQILAAIGAEQTRQGIFGGRIE